MQRTFYYSPSLGEEPYNPEIDARRPVPEDEANLVSSVCEDGSHMPAIDIDRIPVRLVPSSTPGNSHLYIDKAISWDQYAAILTALASAGIIEAGYLGASLARRMTFLRKPGVTKAPKAAAR